MHHSDQVWPHLEHVELSIFSLPDVPFAAGGPETSSFMSRHRWAKVEVPGGCKFSSVTTYRINLLNTGLEKFGGGGV